MGSSGPVVLDRAPPVALVLTAILCVQFGGALAATLLPVVGVLGTVTLRLVLASAVLLTVVRPPLAGRTGRDWVLVGAFATVMATMNMAIYAALSRLPLGVVVTIAFLGPLTLAAVKSRHRRDIAGVLAALVGVVLISGATAAPLGHLDLAGIIFAMAAGASWATYILLSGRTGQRFPGLDGVAIAMTLSAVVVLPIGLATVGPSLWSAEVLLLGLAIALLSSAIPYSLELIALRRLEPGPFGVLMSLEPAAGALAGLLVLGQVLNGLQMAGMATVILASVLVLGHRADRTPGSLEPS